MHRTEVELRIADQRGWKARVEPSLAALLGCLFALAGCGVTSPLFVAESDAPYLPDATVIEFDGSSGPPPGYTGLPCGTGRGCNSTNLGGETCASLGAGAGPLSCEPSSCTFDLSRCTGFPTRPPCGTGPGCNPRDLGGQTCESLGLPAGSIACDPVTCTVDTSMCVGTLVGVFGGGMADDDAGVDGQQPIFGGGATPGGGGTGLFGGGTPGGGGTGIFGGTTGTPGGGTGLFGGGGFFGGGGDLDAGTD